LRTVSPDAHDRSDYAPRVGHTTKRCLAAQVLRQKATGGGASGVDPVATGVDPASDPPPLPSDGELFRLIVESATDFAIFTMDTDRLVTTWNAGAERLFGYSEPEMIGSSADRVFTPEDQARGLPDLEVKQASATGRAADERWHQRRDGTQFWASGLLMRLDQGQGFVKIMRDRTEQHTANEHLRESEERFRLLATSIPQLVFRTRVDGERTWGSPQWIDFSSRQSSVRRAPMCQASRPSDNSRTSIPADWRCSCSTHIRRCRTCL
jgi:PAS domain S-box-containing protein